VLLDGGEANPRGVAGVFDRPRRASVNDDDQRL
jgi:hypothetical protein